MIPPIVSITSDELTKSSSYVNQCGENPKRLTLIYWFYIGQNAKVIKEKMLEIHLNKNFKDGLTPAIPIIE
jgi:hypothetical protein